MPLSHARCGWLAGWVVQGRGGAMALLPSRRLYVPVLSTAMAELTRHAQHQPDLRHALLESREPAEPPQVRHREAPRAMQTSRQYRRASIITGGSVTFLAAWLPFLLSAFGPSGSVRGSGGRGVPVQPLRPAAARGPGGRPQGPGPACASHGHMPGTRPSAGEQQPPPHEGG